MPLRSDDRPPDYGKVIWITGLSGAGKSVIGRRVCALMKEAGLCTVFVDGDLFREVMGQDLGHDLADRRVNALRISRFCRFLSAQGVHVVCATMSLFAECRAWNRLHIPGYYEVYVRVPLETLVARDPHGLYRRALTGQITHIVGIDLPFEEPEQPDLILDNERERTDFTDFAGHILEGARLPALAR